MMNSIVNRSCIQYFIFIVIIYIFIQPDPAHAIISFGDSDAFPIDTVSSVLISSSTHPDQNLWYSQSDVEFSWVPFILAKGYYFIFDMDPSTKPIDKTGEYTNNTQLPARKVYADGAWYFHLVAELDSGLDENVAHYRVNIDSTAPSVISLSHPDQNEWTQSRQVEFVWTMSHPPDMGKFYYQFDDKPDTIPTSKGTATQDTRLSYDLPGDGKWYFHIVWEDSGGKIGAKAAHYTLNADDTDPPTVDKIVIAKQANGDFLLTWQKPVDPASGVAYYQIYRSETKDIIGKKISTDKEVTTERFLDPGAGNLPKTFYYTILTVDKAGNKQAKGTQKVFGEGGNMPLLSADPASLDMGTSDTEKSFIISNNGSDTLSWSIKADLPAWLKASSMSGETAPGKTVTISLSANRQGLSPNTYKHSLTITSNGGNGSVSVTMIVPAPDPSLAVSPLSLDFDTSKTESTFAINNKGGGTLKWNITADLPSWLKASSMSGDTLSGKPSSVKLTVNRQGLAPKAYSHTVSVTSNGGNSSVSVTMTVSESSLSISVSPLSLDFDTSKTENTFTIENKGGGTLKWNITADLPSWLKSSPMSGDTLSGKTASVTLTVNRQGLAPKAYSHKVLVTSNSGNGSVSVTMTVSEPPGFDISAIKNEATASNGIAVYSIVLQGKNGFTGGVTLFDTELPANVSASFDPKKVSFVSEPLVTSQLTLTVPKDTASGDHPFTVLAKPDSGETKELQLILKVPPQVFTTTSMMLILQSTEVPYMGAINPLGQLTTVAGEPVGGARIQIIFTSPGGKTQALETVTKADGSYQLSQSFSPDEIGKWKVKAKFAENAQFKASEREISFSVKRAASKIIFNTGSTGILGKEIMIQGNLEPQLTGQILSLKIIKPDQKVITIDGGITTEAYGIFHHKRVMDISGDWEITITWAGNDKYEGISQKHTISIGIETGKVIIVLGGGDRINNPDWKRFNDVAEDVYKAFLWRGFDDVKDIYLLSPDPDVTAGADHRTSADELKLAITKWAADQVSGHVPLYLYLISHGLGDQFLLEKDDRGEKYLAPAQLDEWLDQIPKGTSVTIIIEACHSGFFISTSDGKPTALVAPDRAIIVSARGDQQAKILDNGKCFSKEFFEKIKANKTMSDAFSETEKFMSRISVFRAQSPLIDGDGDGKVNTLQDYAALKRYLPADILSAGAPPEIIEVTKPQALEKGVSSLRIYARLFGTGITRVYATIIPPDFDPNKTISDWSALKFPEFDLARVTESEFAATYGNFSIPGDYTVIVNAENPDGSATPFPTTITVLKPDYIKGDVNNDGKVNSKDALLTAQFAAEIKVPTDAQKLSADMDNNGIINSKDTILILRKASESAAPILHPEGFNEVPVTALFQNYPNPFNPETWIPYQLGYDADVVIRIYNSAGKLIRALDIGHREAGYYLDRSKAAYWDGRDSVGETAVSGLYFYQIIAGDFVELRKLVIVK